MGRNTCFIVYKPADIVRKASQNDTYIKLYFCTMSPEKERHAFQRVFSFSTKFALSGK